MNFTLMIELKHCFPDWVEPVLSLKLGEILPNLTRPNLQAKTLETFGQNFVSA